MGGLLGRLLRRKMKSINDELDVPSSAMVRAIRLMVFTEQPRDRFFLVAWPGDTDNTIDYFQRMLLGTHETTIQE